jgi:WD40 repeat protein
LQFSADGRFLLGALGNGSVLVWEAATGAQVNEIRGHGHAPGTSFVDRENRILSVCGEGQLRISNLFGGATTLCGAPGTVMRYGVASLAVDSQGMQAAWVERSSSRIIVWDMEKQVVKLEIENPAAVLDLKFSPDGASLAAVGMEPVVRIYDTDSGFETHTINVAKR